MEIYAPPGMINAGESQGREGAGAWNRAWSEAWDEQHYEIREVEVLGPDRAVASVLVVARGRSSGLSTEMRQWWFFEVRDGKIARWHLYPDRDRALAAAEA